MTRRQRSEQVWLITGSLVVLAIVAIGFILTYTRIVMIPFVLAVFITSIVSPMVDVQVLKLGIPRSLAVAVTLLIVVSVFAVIGLLSVQATLNIVKSAQAYSQDIATFARNLLSQGERWNLQISVDDIIRQIQAAIPRLATSTLGSVVGWMAKGVLVLIFVGFLLAARNPDSIRQGVYADIDTQIRRYLGTKVVISAGTGFLVWMTLQTFGLKLASVFGLLAFALNFIPNVGSIIATVLPLPTAVAQFHNQPGVLLAIVAIPGLIQLTIGNVIEPKLMGEGLKLHPVTILLALAIWGLLWGPAGMLLAVPITATLRIVLDQFAITRSASQLLAGQLPGLSLGREAPGPTDDVTRVAEH